MDNEINKSDWNLLTGKIKPKLENPNAPINLISGPIEGNATANATQQQTSNALECEYKLENIKFIRKLLTFISCVSHTLVHNLQALHFSKIDL